MKGQEQKVGCEPLLQSFPCLSFQKNLLCKISDTTKFKHKNIRLTMFFVVFYLTQKNFIPSIRFNLGFWGLFRIFLRCLFAYLLYVLAVRVVIVL